jgi:hypothetical protein
LAVVYYIEFIEEEFNSKMPDGADDARTDGNGDRGNGDGGDGDGCGGGGGGGGGDD